MQKNRRRHYGRWRYQCLKHAVIKVRITGLTRGFIKTSRYLVSGLGFTARASSVDAALYSSMYSKKISMNLTQTSNLIKYDTLGNI